MREPRLAGEPRYVVQFGNGQRDGATGNRLIAIFGWLTEQAMHYTENQRRERLAVGATDLLGKHRTRTHSFPPRD